VTCEIAIMNTRGIALAADSAVSLGDGEKVYHSSDKLFPLAGTAPVAVMTYGCDALMGVPWEIVIADYSSQLGNRQFRTLGEYADDFFMHVEDSRLMFPTEIQTGRFLSHARRIWSKYYAGPWREIMANPPKRMKANRARRIDHLLKLLHADHKIWEKYPPINRAANFFYDELEELGDVSLSNADDIMDEIEKDLCELEEELFSTPDLPFGSQLPEDLREGLRTTLRHFLLRGAFGGGDDSCIVFAGMGTGEIFPSVLHYRVGTMMNNRLKLLTLDEDHITPKITANILPFAQRKMIDLIIEGVHPDLKSRLPDLMEQCHPPRRKKNRPKDEWEDVSPMSEWETTPTDRFRALVDSEAMEKHSAPIMAAVAALSRQDLAEMAESLVHFSRFRMKFLVNERDTVGGPIDVAVLSKADGFIWVKRKRISC